MDYSWSWLADLCKMVELEHVSFDYFYSGMDGFGLSFLKCGKGAGPVLSKGLKPSSAFLAWLCIEVFSPGQWMMLLRRSSSKGSGWGCRLCLGACLRCDTCQSCTALPSGCWGKREWQGCILLVYSTFIFTEVLIGLWSLWNAESQGKERNFFAGQENISHPALKGLPREIFFCLYFSLMSQAPKNVLFHIQSDILTYICLTIWHTYWF